jgi:sugar lactone lactonase YvrE
MTRERVEQLGPEVAEAARRIGAQLELSDVPPTGELAVALPGPNAEHGALPRWSPERAALFWADTRGACVHLFQAGSDVSLAPTKSPVTGLVLHRDGVLVAHEEGWHVLDERGKVKARSGWPGSALCAMCVHPGGEPWVAMRRPGGSQIGILGPAGDFLDKWQVPEPVGAIAWDAAGESLYAAAPESGSILVARPGARTVRRLGTLPKGSGQPAGLALDAEGGVWTALTDGWSVVRFSPDGALNRVFALPVPRPTDLAFGGPRLDTLYVTSSRHGIAAEILASAPLSGRLFELAVDLAGVPSPVAR